MKNERYIEEELMEAFTLEKSDAEIGMPDIEAELLKVRSSVGNFDGNASNRTVPLIRIASIAASILLVLGIGIAAYYNNLSEDDNVCIAYIGGEKITDEATIMNMLVEDMSLMNADNEIIEDQLNDIFNE